LSGDAHRPAWKRYAWFVALWAASVAVLGVVAYAIRAVIL
jgi:hypothetical protein